MAEGDIEGDKRVNKLLFIAASILLAGCASTVPDYYEPWQPEYHQQFDDIRIQVAAHGLLAPNAHNTQPWVVKLDNDNPGVFELFVDSERLLPETDPPARQITISQGTFLETAKIASNHLVYDFDSELFPNGEYGIVDFKSEMLEKPVARVSLSENLAKVSPTRLLTGTGQANLPNVNPMYYEIFQRVTNRTAYSSEPLNDEEMAVLQLLNNNPNLTLAFFNNTKSLEIIRQLTIDAVEVEATTQQTMKETERLFRDSEKEKKKYRDGITMMSGGLSGFKLMMIQFLSNLFPVSWEKMGDIWLKSETRNIKSAPTYAMIISSDNSRTTQVETGMLYARFQLKASTLGISMQPLSQVLQEFPEMAELYNTVHDEFSENGQNIQMLVRMGRADDVLHSPRRDALDLIQN